MAQGTLSFKAMSAVSVPLPDVIALSANAASHSLSPLENHVEMIVDDGNYYLYDYRTHELQKVIAPPLGEEWSLEPMAGKPGFVYVAADTESHWVSLASRVD